MNTQKILSQIEAEALGAFRDFGYAKETIRSMMSVVRTILRKHKERRFIHFNEKVALSYILSEEKRHNAGEIGRQNFFFRKKTAEYLMEINDTGVFSYKRYKTSPELIPYFEKLLNGILENPDWNSKTCQRYYDIARPFLKWLTSQEHNDLANTNERVLRD